MLEHYVGTYHILTVIIGDLMYVRYSTLSVSVLCCIHSLQGFFKGSF